MKEKNYKYAFVVISDTRSSGENKDGCIDACQKIMPENYKMVYKDWTFKKRQHPRGKFKSN